MRPTIGGSLARRRAASSSGWPCDRDHRPRQLEQRQRAAADLGDALDDLANALGEPIGAGAEGGVVGGEHLQHGDVPVAAVEAERGLERGERQLVEPQRAGERVLLGSLDRGARADHHAGLRAAEQFVSGETHERGAGPDRAPHRAARRRALRCPRRGCPSRRRRSPARRARTAPRSRPPARSRAGGSSTGGRGGWRRCARLVRWRSPRGGCDWWCRPRAAWRRPGPPRRGSRKPPPISTSWPRETTISLPGPASAAAASRTAAAPLLTASAASAPVSSVRRCSTWAWREPRVPVSASHSRLE